MAEVYGEKPKKFTKKWWPYFWMYYKWHTISIVAIAVVIISTVMQCVTAEKYDLILTYLGRLHISQEHIYFSDGDSITALFGVYIAY